jgi:hypothetical protein
MNFTGNSQPLNIDLEQQQQKKQATCCQKLWNVLGTVIYAILWCILIWYFWDPIVSYTVFAAVLVGWIGITALLIFLVHFKNINFGGVDQAFFDIFNIPHFLFGVVMGLSGLPLVEMLLAAVVWEVFEKTSTNFGEKESYINRLGDLLMATGGWFLMRGLVAQSFVWY